MYIINLPFNVSKLNVNKEIPGRFLVTYDASLLPIKKKKVGTKDMIHIFTSQIIPNHTHSHYIIFLQIIHYIQKRKKINNNVPTTINK